MKDFADLAAERCLNELIAGPAARMLIGDRARKLLLEKWAQIIREEERKDDRHDTKGEDQ